MRNTLTAAFEEGDPALMARALGVVARAQSITDLAKKIGLTRQALYKAFSGTGNPEFRAVVKVADELGYKLAIKHAAGI